MKNISRKLIAFTLMAVLLIAGSSMAFAEDNAPKVILNGEYIAFTDVSPINVNGSVMVPFTAVLEKLGATVDWNQETKVVTAVRGDQTLTFQIGKSEAQLKTGDTTKTIDISAPPFVQNNRTYVGIRFMAEAFGYTVGWDSSEKTAVIVDYDSIFADYDQDFTILNKLFTTDASTSDMNTTYKTNMKLKLDVSIYETMIKEILGNATGKQCDVSVTGDVVGISKGMDADMTMNLKLDITNLLAQVTSDQKAELQKIADSYGTINVAVKLNGETGDCYVQCNLFSVLDETISKDAWMKMNIYEVYESMGIDFKGIMQMSTNLATNGTTMKDLMIQTLKTNNAMTVDTYAETKAAYAILKGIVGDDAFKVTEAGNKTTYTVNFDGADVLTQAIKELQASNLDLSATDIAEMKEAMSQVLSMKGSMSMVVSNDKVVSSDVSVSFKMDEVTMDIAAKGTQTDADMTMTFDITDMAKVTLTMTGSSVETSSKIDVNPPSGAQIIDMMSME